MVSENKRFKLMRACTFTNFFFLIQENNYPSQFWAPIGPKRAGGPIVAHRIRRRDITLQRNLNWSLRLQRLAREM